MKRASSYILIIFFIIAFLPFVQGYISSISGEDMILMTFFILIPELIVGFIFLVTCLFLKSSRQKSIAMSIYSMIIFLVSIFTFFVSSLDSWIFFLYYTPTLIIISSIIFCLVIWKFLAPLEIILPLYFVITGVAIYIFSLNHGQNMYFDRFILFGISSLILSCLAIYLFIKSIKYYRSGKDLGWMRLISLFIVNIALPILSRFILGIYYRLSG